LRPEEKVWGEALHVFGNDACAVSVLTVKRGFRCSDHFHMDRINRFVVKSGKIVVVIGDPPEQITLSAGQMVDVEPRKTHRFEVLEDGVVIEVYFPKPVRFDDIVRFNSGGRA